MKTNRLFNVLAALLLMFPLCMVTSCSEEDAPELTHSVDELSGDWTWDFNDDSAPVKVTVTKISSNEIAIDNFHNMDGDRITMNVSGTSLSFSGSIAGDALTISEGIGTIINGWQGMTLSYLTTDSEGEQERFDITLTKGYNVAKKAIVQPN